MTRADGVIGVILSCRLAVTRPQCLVPGNNGRGKVAGLERETVPGRATGGATAEERAASRDTGESRWLPWLTYRHTVVSPDPTSVCDSIST